MGPCIWYVSKYVVTPESGEPASRGFALMREFSRLGYEAVIITSDSMGKFNAPVAQQPYELEEHQGITLCRLRTLKYSQSKSLRRIFSWLHFEERLLRLPRRSLPEPDVIITSSLSLLTVLNGLRLRRKYHCRLIFEVRDIWPLTIIEEGGFSAYNPLVLALGGIEKLGYRKADAIVGTMPNLGPHVEGVVGRELPTYCIPMGVDTDALSATEPLPPQFVTDYIPTGKFIVGYAGSIGISNAMDSFFECVSSMQGERDVHFVVLGEGELRQSYLNRYGDLPNLTFAPRVPKTMVNDFLTRCDILYLSVHDSRVWDYGLSLNKLIDYMLSGKPVIASYSGYPSMIDEADCGTFVPAGDIPALRAEIDRFREMSPAMRATIGARGREWLLQQRNYQALARDYLEILFPDEAALGH